MLNCTPLCRRSPVCSSFGGLHSHQRWLLALTWPALDVIRFQSLAILMGMGWPFRPLLHFLMTSVAECLPVLFLCPYLPLACLLAEVPVHGSCPFSFFFFFLVHFLTRSFSYCRAWKLRVFDSCHYVQGCKSCVRFWFADTSFQSVLSLSAWFSH